MNKNVNTKNFNVNLNKLINKLIHFLGGYTLEDLIKHLKNKERRVNDSWKRNK